MKYHFIKKVIVLLLLLGSYVSFAQSTLVYTVTTQDLTVCGSSKQFSVKVTNSNASDLTATYNVTLTPGLVISNFSSTPSGATLQLTSPNVLSVSVLVPAQVSSGAVVSFTVQAGCNVAMGQNSVITGTMTVSGNPDYHFNINSNTNGTLFINTVSRDISWDQSGSLGSILNREFKLVNNTQTPFTGFIKFNDVPNSGVSIQNVEVLLPGASQPVTIGNNEALQVTNIQPGHVITINETVKVINCVLKDDGQTNAVLSWGCLQNDYCSQANITLNITPGTDSPKIDIVSEESSIQDYFECFGEENFTDRYITYKNSGTAATEDLRIHFHQSGSLIIPYNDFKIKITRSNGTVVNAKVHRAAEHQNPDCINHADYEGCLAHYYRTTTVGNTVPSGYFDVVINSSKLNKDGLFVASNNADVIGRLVITEYIVEGDPANEIHSLVLNPGDKITLIWKEKQICLNPQYLAMRDFTGPGIDFYYSTCTNPEYKARADALGLLRVLGGQSVLPFYPMLNGNPDKCYYETKDGDIREFKIKNSIEYLTPVGNDVQNWGELEVVLSIDEGATLDLTNGNTATVETYNHDCGGPSYGCGNCQFQVWSSTDPVYRINIVDPLFGNIEGTVVNVDHITFAYPNSDNNKRVYTVRFNLQNFWSTIPPGSITAYPQDFIKQRLSASDLVFSVRAYCFKAAPVRIFETLNYVPPCGTCSVPIAKTDFKFIVTCPGCVTPGGNIAAATMERTDEYLGFEDGNLAGTVIDDGIPDNNTLVSSGILKSRCTNGDVLEGNVVVVLSDGERDIQRNGFLLADLAAQGIYLTSLYLKVEISGEGSIGAQTILDLESGSTPQVSINGGTSWANVYKVVKLNGNFYYQIRASDLGYTDFSQSLYSNSRFGKDILIQSRYKVSQLLSETGSVPLSFYIMYNPYFSDCDDCLSELGLSSNMIDATNNIYCGDFDHNGVHDCGTFDENMKYICQAGMGVFNFIPCETTVRRVDSPDSCGHIISLDASVRFINGGHYLTNPFSNEYRPLMDGKEFTYKSVIPTGYKVKSAVISTSLNFRNVQREAVYTINSSSVQSYIINNHFQLTAKFKKLDPGQLVDNNENSVPYTGQDIYVLDDGMACELRLYLEPISCGLPDEQIIYNLPANPFTNVGNMGLVQYNSPTVTVPDCPSQVAATLAGTEIIKPIFRPTANLTARIDQDIYFTNARFYIPVNISNLDLEDANGIDLRDFRGNLVGSKDAAYPFMYFPNINNLNLEGISIEHVYQGIVNESTNTSDYKDFYNSTTNIAGLGRGTQNTTIKGGTTNTYTIVLSYACPQGCSPILPQYNSPVSDLPPCIRDPKTMNINYGWGCKAYPVSSAEIAGSCNVKSISTVLHPSGVGVQYFSTLNNGEPIDLCEAFPYTITVKSTELGTISDYNLIVNLPSGVAYVSTVGTLVPSVNGQQLLYSDVLETLNISDFNSGDELQITIWLKLNNVSEAVISKLDYIINGESYCGTLFTRSGNDIITAAPTFTNLQDSYCTGMTNPVTLIPVASGGTYTAPTGFIDNGDGTLTFTPSLLTPGQHSITYHLPNSACVATFNVNITSTLTVKITPPDAEATLLCDGHSSVDLTAEVEDGAAPYTYDWTYGSSIPGTTSVISQTIPDVTHTITANQIAWYTVVVTDNNGCTGMRSVEVKNSLLPKCPDDICPGEMPTMQVNMGGVVGTYTVQWYSVANPTIPISSSIGAEGQYFAWVVTPACSLQTAACNIVFKPRPPAYTITANGSLNLLPTATVDLTGTAPNDITDVASATWSNGTVLTDLNNPGSITASNAGPYFITSIGSNGCTNTSNVLVVNKPELIVIGDLCDNILMVVSNTQNATYAWSYDDGTGPTPVPAGDYINSDGSSIFANYPGYYWVETTNGVVSANYYYVTYVPPLTTGTNMLSAAEGSFDGLNDCSVSNSQTVIGSSYTCFDHFPALSNPQPGQTPENQYDYTQMPGQYIIVPGAPVSPNGNPATAMYWNRGLWDATHMSILPDANYMIVDGAAEATSRAVWSKSGISVSHREYYKFSASIASINLNTPNPVGTQFEFSDYELHISKSWDSHVDVIRGQRFFAANNSQYIDIEGLWKADLSGSSDPTMPGTISISLVLRGGGVIGRDVAIDNVIFAPVGTCPTPLSPQVRYDRACEATADVISARKFTCTGLSATFEIPKAVYNSNLQYTWHSVTDDNISATSLDSDNNRFFNAPSGGEYALKVRDVQNQCFAVRRINVHIITPTLEISSDKNVVCSGNNDVVYTVEGYDGILGAQYKWYVNNNPVTTNATGTYTVQNATSSTVVKCELISGCSGAAVFSNVITLSGAQTPVNAGTDVAICTGSSATLAATNAVTYSWSPSAGLSATNVATPTANPTATTTYIVTGTDANGCTSTDEVVVTVNAKPTVNAGADIIRCHNGSTSQLNATGAVSYSWSPATNLSATNIANPVVSLGTSNTTYTVTGTDANGCTNTDQVLVYIVTGPDVSAGSDVSVCSGNSTTLTANGPPVNGYSWSPSTGLSSTTIYNPVASPAATTTYTVTVSANLTAPGGIPFTCYASDQVIVTVNARPTVNAGADVIRCYDGTTSQLNATGAAAYSWSPTSGLSAANIANPTVGPGPTMSTTYTVTGTSAQGCTNTDQVIVHIVSPPAVSAGSDKTMCIGGSATLNGSSPTGNYSWSPSTGLSATNIYNPVANPSVTTTYTLTSTGTTTSNGVPVTCVVTDQVIVTVNTPPTVNAGADVSTCLGTGVNLLASGATTYSWSPSTGLSSATVANPVASPSSTTTYTVTGTTNGCSNTDQVVVTIKTLPSVSAGSDKVICTGSVTINGSGATTYSWSPSTGLSSTNVDWPTANPTVTTTYTLTGTGSNGCTATDQVVVGVVPAPGILFNGNDLTANLGTLPSGVSISTSPINYKWEYSTSSGGSYTTKSSCTGSSTCTKALLQNYWKLTMIYDMPGGSTCTLTSTPDNARIAFDKETDVVVYPVPVHDELYVEYHSDTTLISITMYDVLGKEVLKKQINTKATVINVHDIPAGVYVINFIDARNVLHTKRVEIIH